MHAVILKSGVLENRATEGNLGQRVIWDIFEHNGLF